MARAARLSDVAKLAGVSIRTVSNVVNGYVPVSEERRKRVDAAVKQLGYRPNAIARNLKNGQSRIIALLVPELSVPYFSELASAVVTRARQSGYTVVVDETNGEPDREREIVWQQGDSTLFDAVILSPLALSQRELPPAGESRPLVLLGERIVDSQYDHVSIDNVAAARLATTHLIELGRTRIAAIGDQPYETGETAQLRTSGYKLALEEHGIPLDRRLIVERKSFHFADGADAVAELAARADGLPDALFCYNDLVAIGALRELHTRGVRVPDDVAVVGFDDIEAAAQYTPSLTSIAPDRQVIAQLAVDRILSRLGSGPQHPPEELFAPHRLVVRESTVGSAAVPSSRS